MNLILMMLLAATAGNMPVLRSKCLHCDYKPVMQRMFVGEHAYSGGLALSEICPESSLANAGVVEGDILIGLGEFETVTPSDLEYVLSHNTTKAALKFYIIRGGEVYFGHIDNPRYTPATSRLFGRAWR